MSYLINMIQDIWSIQQLDSSIVRHICARSVRQTSNSCRSEFIIYTIAHHVSHHYNVVLICSLTWQPHTTISRWCPQWTFGNCWSETNRMTTLWKTTTSTLRVVATSPSVSLWSTTVVDTSQLITGLLVMPFSFFYAGAAFSKLLSITRNAVKEATMMELYESTIAALDTSSFFVSTNCFFTRTFRRIDELLTAEPLYCNYHDYRTKMRNILLPLFPKDLVTMKSSRGFNKSCNSVYVTTFGRGVSKLKEFHVVLKNTRGNLSPQYWEYTKSSW